MIIFSDIISIIQIFKLEKKSPYNSPPEINKESIPMCLQPVRTIY